MSSRDLLYSIVLEPAKLYRALKNLLSEDGLLMLSVLTINKKEHRKLLKVEDMMMISQEYAYGQTHQIIYINHGQFICI